MIKLESNLKKYSLLIPTSINEFTPEILNSMTSNINLAPNYAIVAIIYKTKLFEFSAAIDKKYPTEVGVIPIIAKISDEDADKVNTQVGYKVNIVRSMIERGEHINLPNNTISIDKVRSFIKNDPQLSKDIMTGEYFKQDGKTILESKNNSPYCYFPEFKIIPVCDIHASYDITTPINEVFVEQNKVN